MENEIKSKILIVDDDSAILETMQDVLELEGFNVEKASDGFQAQQLLKSLSLDLVITDIKMPGMGGIGLLKIVKELDKNLPVIIITGFASIDTAIEAMRQGAYDYITKPFEMKKFISIVERALQQRQLHIKNKLLLNDLGEVNKTLNKKVNQLITLNDVGKAIGSILDFENLLGTIVNTTTQLMEAEVGSVMLLDKTQKKLEIRVSRGLNKDVINKVHLKVGEGIIGLVASRGKALYTQMLNNKISLTDKDKEIFQSDRFLSVPLLVRNKVLGVLNVSNPRDGKFTKEDLDLLFILANQAAATIENSRLYENLQSSYVTVMNILTTAMEAKSEYTSGHSERVANYAILLAKDIGLGSDEIDKLYHVCMLHDLGKITISDFILNKPEFLNSQEWEEVRLHPARGGHILKPLGFLDSLIPIIRAHHERLDGKGYPDGLKGDNIPFGARIISIVDSFDAMTSLRPYREAFIFSNVIKEIKNNIGSKYDPKIGQVFIDKTSKKLKINE